VVVFPDSTGSPSPTFVPRFTTRNADTYLAKECQPGQPLSVDPDPQVGRSPVFSYAVLARGIGHQPSRRVSHFLDISGSAESQPVGPATQTVADAFGGGDQAGHSFGLTHWIFFFDSPLLGQRGGDRGCAGGP